MSALANAVAPVATDTGTMARVGFGAVVRAEWIKLWSVRSTWWTVIAMVVLGAGLTILMCGLNAEWLASPTADESAGSFITWGMMIAQVCAVIVGVLAVTSEYGTGSYFLDREGIGLALEGDVARAMYGSGLFMAGLALFSMATGFLVRHTAAAISIVLALVFVIGNMVMLVPGDLGLWLARLMPGNAGGEIAVPVSFIPDLLGAWTGFGVFAAETAALLGLAWLLLRRRDA